MELFALVHASNSLREIETKQPYCLQIKVKILLENKNLHKKRNIYRKLQGKSQKLCKFASE